MCDEFTAIEDEAALAGTGVSRRQFAALGGAAALAGWTPAVAAATAPVAISEKKVLIPTADGQADAWFYHPAKGKHPGVIFWPDIAGPREAMFQMGKRLASSGYAVLVVNQYYRAVRAPFLATLGEFRTPEGQAKLAPAMQTVNQEGITRDAKAFVAWLDKQKAVNAKRKIGTQGYCMGGPFTVYTAAAVPNRVGAAASFHGGGLVAERPGSPHNLLKSTRASYLFAIARNDDARAPTDKDKLREAAAAAKRPAEIEVYPADHGWCALDAPVYDQVQADRAWGRLLALYAKL
jgi:carboxymethylenebutenolidase